jgi:UDP-3-O-[3-hydroxymyristoyl] N-acetylglucosamine deacetylase
MLEIYQKTISKAISFEGIGLHSGINSKVTILPGKPNQGIIFKRIDLQTNNLVAANYENVSSAKLCTTLENKYGVKISTVEHLLAAIYIVGIDNAIIEIDNEEVPIMDGSAKFFLNLFKKSEINELNEKIKYIKILNKVELIDGSRKISIKPNDNFEVDFQLNYQNKIIDKQRNVINFQNDDLSDVVESRTFCLYEDIEKIKKLGLARGGSLDNAVVVDGDKVLNNEGLRNEKEFVNHKILDLAGDFLLSGFKILGKIECYQGGHELSNMFLRKLLKFQKNYLIIELEDTIISKKTNLERAVKIAVNA